MAVLACPSGEGNMSLEIDDSIVFSGQIPMEKKHTYILIDYGGEYAFLVSYPLSKPSITSPR